MTEAQAKYGKNAVEISPPTYSQRFTSMVVREFGSTVGKLELSPYQMVLAQHLFIGVDQALKALEADRIKKGQDKKLPIVWANVNMEKLSVDAVHRVELGLDALVGGHIYPIPYMNSKTGKYDLDLRIGYVGKDYYRREMATVKPLDIKYELVCETDKFTAIMKPGAESYTFEIADPFNRGKVVGGFGYIIYEDPTKNKLILVSKADFDKSKSKSGSDQFWGPYEVQMQYKTLVNRVTARLPVDPKKVNASFAAVELDDADREIQENANTGPVIDIEPEPEGDQPMTEEEKAEALEREAAEADAYQQPTTGKAANGQARVPGF